MALNHIWQLMLGDHVIATIHQNGYEFPWILGVLVDSPVFEKYRLYFMDDNLWPENGEMDALFDEIDEMGGRFSIVNLSTGERYGEPRLNHDEEYVWFRV